MRELTMDMEFPGEDDGHREAPEAATTATTNPPDGSPEDMATKGREVATIVATSEPGRWALAARSARQMAAHWVSMRRADAGRHGGLLHTAVHGRPESLAELHDYASNRAWVPEGHPGGVVVSGVPAAYYRLLGEPAVAAGLAWIWVWSRLLHLAVTVLVAGIIVILVAVFT